MRLGASVEASGTRFSVQSLTAERIWLCLFDAAGDEELDRIALDRTRDDEFAAFVPGMAAGARYGLRADGPYEPASGHWFDPAKLLVDPRAFEIDRPYRYDARLGALRSDAVDTAPLMPKCVLTSPAQVTLEPPLFTNGGLIYEVPVRAFSMLHPDVPEGRRGTVAALAEPAVIEHFRRLGVSAVELMPITAWIDERHLPPLGLTNGWGYNPVSFMALDPRLVPGGWAELRETVAALRAAGIGVILDLVFNHTGESDAAGPTLSLRGLDNRTAYRHLGDGSLANDTGCGNTLDCAHPAMVALVLDALRAFVRHAGVDGFRFDLAPVLGRRVDGFDPDAPLLGAMLDDPEIGGRVLIAEPWDIGPGGYQLGNFPGRFLEWNDRYRDDIRRFWRGDAGMAGALATRLAGSSDIFRRGGRDTTRSVSFLAAHDGFSLVDLVSYERKHNAANGEDNRDGHDENLSWNGGVEGETDDAAVKARRAMDLKALLSTLFYTRGTIMLTAGDEFGRTQAGNNNAYAQDNPITWLDWEHRDRDLEAFAFALATARASDATIAAPEFLTGDLAVGSEHPDVQWFGESGRPLEVDEWQDPDRRLLAMVLGSGTAGGRLAVVINGSETERRVLLPIRDGHSWQPEGPRLAHRHEAAILIPERAVVLMREVRTGPIRE